jgi:hypothetical protein
MVLRNSEVHDDEGAMTMSLVQGETKSVPSRMIRRRPKELEYIRTRNTSMFVTTRCTKRLQEIPPKNLFGALCRKKSWLLTF